MSTDTNDDDRDSLDAAIPWLCTTSSIQQRETEELVAGCLSMADGEGLELNR